MDSPTAGQERGDVAFEQLLDQIEGVDDFPDMADLAVAQRVEASDVELHHALIDVLAKEHADERSRLVAIDDQHRHLAAQLRIASPDRLPHLAHFGLAAAVAHMRQDVDRGVGEELDVIGAARQRGFDVAGIQGVEKVQHELTIRCLGHSPTLPVFDSALAAGSIVNGTMRRSISKWI